MIYKTSSLVKFSHTLLPSRMSIISLIHIALFYVINTHVPFIYNSVFTETKIRTVFINYFIIPFP